MGDNTPDGALPLVHHLAHLDGRCKKLDIATTASPGTTTSMIAVCPSPPNSLIDDKLECYSTPPPWYKEGPCGRFAVSGTQDGDEEKLSPEPRPCH
ncbi:unnamed protein product, partial [Mesorhabditis spiculigera]